MKKREEMLVITMEECGELIQACSKVIRTKGKTKYLRNLQDRVSDLEDEIVDQMGNDGREIINNMNTFGKNVPDEQKINYYRDILRREAEDLPDINNPLDDMP